MKNTYHYTVKMFNPDNQLWETKNRYYSVKKDLNDFDLKDIPGKRMGAKFIEQIIPGDYTGYEINQASPITTDYPGIGCPFDEEETKGSSIPVTPPVNRISDALALIDRLKSTPDLIKVKNILTGIS